MAIIISFAVSVILCPIVIPILKKMKFGQYIREEGPESHKSKAGTPTMGGMIILFSLIVTSLFFIKDYPKIVPILFVTIGFGIVGFLDDFIKVVMKRNEGLNQIQKMLCEIVITAIFAFYMVKYSGMGTEIIIPFTHGQTVDMGWLFIPMLFFVVLGTVNGANFTDGLDGLATSVTLMIAVFFMVVSIGTNSGIAPVTAALAGALMGFLLFNVYPARVFMGDTGSLTIGGIIAVFAIIIHKELLIPILCGVFLVENLSVILQRAYYKAGKRKGVKQRLFKRTPIHDHFRTSMSLIEPGCTVKFTKPDQLFHESKITVRFWIVTIVLAAITIITLKIR